jgi:hypothetical protein
MGVTTNRMPNGRRAVESVRPVHGGVMRTVSYGRGHIAVQRPIEGRPGFIRHSYYVGGRASAVVYGTYHYRGFAFYRPVPAYIYSPAFYSWGLRPWGPPVAYAWGWQAQPWYGIYGPVFTPYSVYPSLALWMTDYVIAANLQASYAAGQPVQGMTGNVDPGPDQNYNDADAAPPTITPEMKNEIAAQVKLEMEEQQKTAAGGADAVVGPVSDSATGAQEEVPDALKPGHTIFRVVAPLSVKADGKDCNLNPDDYIARTGAMNPDGTVNVTVKASRPVDCTKGAQTQIALNDLMTMESDQQERIMEGFQTASKNMGKNGLPSGPAAGATPVAAGQTAPDPGLVNTLQQQQLEGDSVEKQVSTLGGAGL